METCKQQKKWKYASSEMQAAKRDFRYESSKARTCNQQTEIQGTKGNGDVKQQSETEIAIHPRTQYMVMRGCQTFLGSIDRY